MTTLHVRGEVDLTNRQAFEVAIERRLDTGGDLAINLSQLTFIDAAGLRALARAAGRQNGRGRQFRLDHPSSHLRRLLVLVGLEHYL
ncbi:STAS domain-containing protein [Actinoplanes sp. LDG1-06]|uniref:STAS domain-containing protein n=1 Tax=Paractinoplanes ovalisporus TaxID=2810368 RepID=A0ABS2A582_9ACTN|nr:STAS domain-containing protein [Actinoplanes ovalisporus]MBM2614957.1 STAS domain-containing protein [Actinoplanes ovalisporus]